MASVTKSMATQTGKSTARVDRYTRYHTGFSALLHCKTRAFVSVKAARPCSGEGASVQDNDHDNSSNDKDEEGTMPNQDRLVLASSTVLSMTTIHFT